MANVTVNNSKHKFMLNGNEYLVSSGLNANLIEKTITENGTYVPSDDSIEGNVDIYRHFPYSDFDLNAWTEFEIPSAIRGYFSQIWSQISYENTAHVSHLNLSAIADYSEGMSYSSATRMYVSGSAELYIAKSPDKIYFYQKATEATFKLAFIAAKNVSKIVDGYSKIIIDIS